VSNLHRKRQLQSSLLRRRGVTLLEVMFATGIAIFGLVGVASLLAVAGRNASSANQSSEGQSYGRFWYHDFMTRGYNERAAWRWFNDQLNPGNRFVTVPNGVARGTSSSAPPNRTMNRHAVCIDPYFFAAPANIGLSTGEFPSDQAYRPGLFPYYQDNYNPLSHPNPNSGNPAFMDNNLARLLRCSVGSGAAGGTLLTAKQIEQIFLSQDDLVVTADEDDKTIPVTRLFNDAGGRSRGEYSWFVTLCPRELTLEEPMDLSAPEDYYTLSLVVCHRRDVAVDASVGTPQGERLLVVRSPSNPDAQPDPFLGGAGGRVEVAASTAIDDGLQSGAWMMLLRHQETGSAERTTIARWYRVIAREREATENFSNNTWSRTVVLDGPDWAFDPNHPTQAVLVPSAVTVLERVVRIR
jgi:Tfp pilus assembly protein PilV